MIRTSFKSRVGNAARIIAAIAVLASGAMAPIKALAIEPVVRAIVSDHSVPACTESAVIETIRSKFWTADDRILRQGLSIGQLDKIAQSYAGKNDPSPYMRRYCEAKATLSNGKTTKLYYLVEQDAGFTGSSWNVEFCMAAYEPWNVHDGRCHTVRHRWW